MGWDTSQFGPNGGYVNNASRFGWVGVHERDEGLTHVESTVIVGLDSRLTGVHSWFLRVVEVDTRVVNQNVDMGR